MGNGAERYLKDIRDLARRGGLLAYAMQKTFSPDAAIKNDFSEEDLADLPDVRQSYQSWYSEALALITQLLPDRAEDFKSYYAPKGARKEILHSNYTMTDYLRGVTITRNGMVLVEPSSGLSPMYQQFNIVQGLQRRFASSLYDIKTLVHADLLDDELEAAETLNANGFARAAGAVAGVVLEGHLAAVRERHHLPIRKKEPSIADLNEALKSASIIEVSQWRFVQHLADLRNKCDHKKGTDPTKQEVAELIEGVRKIIKTIM
jgi:hypothetical protein